MSKTVVISDCHIGSPESNYRAVNKFLRELECDKLILAGDFWDLWDSTADRIKARHEDTVLLLNRLMSCGTKIEMILGNHEQEYPYDPIISQDKIPVVDSCEVRTVLNRRIAVIHGHDFDPLYTTYYAISRSLAWMNLISRKIFRVSYKTFKNGQLDTSGEDASCLAQKNHKNAIETYLRCGYDGLIMGHSHHPCHVQAGTGAFEFVNAGDWKYHNTYVEVEDDDIRLLQFNQ